MQRYFLTLSYHGLNYVGWQIQPNGISVQQKLQDALATVFRIDAEVVGAGRTDAGVHAHSMVAHFDAEYSAYDHPDFVKKLNSYLPSDIAVNDIKKVKPEAHARFSALYRTYKYYLTTAKNPFLNDTSARIYFYPDVDYMNILCKILMEYDDFTSFSKLHTDTKTNICSITEAFWDLQGDKIVFTITANRFLRNMVRSIVGTLLDGGRGKLDETEFRNIIESKNRSCAGTSAAAKGLFLHSIVYPENIWM